MMDFLRRLAPSRESAATSAATRDATRAVAVLPSLFASETPLRTTIARLGRAQGLDKDETALSLDANPTVDAIDEQPRYVTGVPRFQASPRSLANRPTRRDNGKAASSTDAIAEARDIDVADPRGLQVRGAHSERAGPVGPELNDLAAMAAGPSRRGVLAPTAQARVPLPLSQSTLAQHTLRSRDDGQVVHVTIGRIDVVANTAPAPAMRPGSKPREASLTLADYLRGGKESRR